MLNSQLLNNMGDFFTAFTEMVKLAQEDKLESVVGGLTQARADLAAHADAKADLAELATFKTTKASQLQEISDAKGAVDEAARLNTEHAEALTSASEMLDTQRNEYKKDISAIQAREDAVKAREDAVVNAENDVKNTQAKADQALADASTLKQSYIAKLKNLANTEATNDGSTGS